jgi:multisubunit Na+/H+ antiporter MnhG subunit
MAAGYLRGKKYTPLQIFSVAILTLGVMVSAWADASSKASYLLFFFYTVMLTSVGQDQNCQCRSKQGII